MKQDALFQDDRMLPELTTEKVYLAKYNPMIHESCYLTLSVHRTRKGAEMAMEFHKSESIKHGYGGKYADWFIEEKTLET